MPDSRGGPLWHPAGFSTWSWAGLFAQDLKAGTAARVQQHPIKSIEGGDGHKRHVGTQEHGSATEHSCCQARELPRWQSPYSIQSSLKTILYPWILNLKDVRICPDHSTRRLQRLCSFCLSMLIIYLGKRKPGTWTQTLTSLSTKRGVGPVKRLVVFR